MIKRALRFSVSGLLATCIHVMVASILITRMQVLPAWANGLAFLIASCSSLMINTYWSFSTRLDAVIIRRYALVSVAGFTASGSISQAVDVTGAHYAWGIFAVVCVMPCINFIMHHYWTYRTN